MTQNPSTYASHRVSSVTLLDKLSSSASSADSQAPVSTLGSDLPSFFPTNLSPHAHFGSISMSCDFSTEPRQTSKVSIFRHHRHPSNASEASSNTPCLDGFSSALPTHLPLNLPAAPHHDEGPALPSPYVDEPLPMEGDFASMDLRSSSRTMTHFFSDNTPPINLNSQTLRYNTLTWAKEHDHPEPRQDTMLSTGGLRPKASIGSLTAMLENQSRPDPSCPSLLHQYHAHQTDHSTPSSSQPEPLTNLGLEECAASLHSPPCPSPNPDLCPSYSGISLQQQVPAIILPPAHPLSPSLRLNINHPDMPYGPSISLTSATPLTARPVQGTECDDFQKVLDDMVNAHNSPPIQSQRGSPVPVQRPGGDQAGSLVFTPSVVSPFLDTRPPRYRQRSKSESIAKHIPFPPPLNLLSSPSLDPPPPCEVTPDACSSLGFGPADSPLELSPSFWAALHQASRSQAPPPPSHTSPALASSAWQPVGCASPDCPSPEGHDGQPSIDGPSPKDHGQPLLDVPLRRRAGGPGYDAAFLQPTGRSSYRRAYSVSPGHRRGRSEGQLWGGHGPTSFALPALGPGVPLPSPVQQSFSSPGPHLETIFQGAEAPLPHPTWLSHFLVGGSACSASELRSGSPARSDNCLPQESPRPRSHSHSSFESEETSASAVGFPVEYKSRTTAATKAAAARRRKEGVAALYKCDMCGETFTRRYNLRGHQRAHRGEKPFECGFPGCKSRFARAHDQKRHYKLHLGVKDYNCKVCGKAFIRLDALQRHHKSDAGHACYHTLRSTGHLPQDYDVNLSGQFSDQDRSGHSHQSSVSPGVADVRSEQGLANLYQMSSQHPHFMCPSPQQ